MTQTVGLFKPGSGYHEPSRRAAVAATRGGECDIRAARSLHHGLYANPGLWQRVF